MALKAPTAADGKDMPASNFNSPNADGRYGISRDPIARGWAKYMQDIHGWSPDKTYTSILNYGWGQLNDFFSSDSKAYSKSIEQGIGRSLGQLSNSYNPDAIDKQPKGALEKDLASRKSEIYDQLKNMKSTVSKFGSFMDKSDIDQYNGMLASATKWYGKDVVDKSGFLPGGSPTVTIDTIGSTTGQSQPQTYTIDQKTGAVSGGDITPVASNKNLNSLSDKELAIHVMQQAGINPSANNKYGFILKNGKPYLSGSVQDLGKYPEIATLYNKAKLQQLKTGSNNTESLLTPDGLAGATKEMANNNYDALVNQYANTKTYSSAKGSSSHPGVQEDPSKLDPSRQLSALSNIARGFTVNVQKTPTGLTQVGKEMRASGYSNEPTFILSGKDKNGNDITIKINPKTKAEVDNIFNIAQSTAKRTGSSSQYSLDTDSGGESMDFSNKSPIYDRLSNQGTQQIINDKTGFKTGNLPFSSDNPNAQRGSGMSKDEVQKLYLAKEKTGQTSVDSNSLAAWAIKNGYTPNFGETSAINKILDQQLNKPSGQNGLGWKAPSAQEAQNINSYLQNGFPSGGSAQNAPSKDSEIARAKQVWENADSLAGTGKYVGKTADQIRESAHAYAESLRNGGSVDPTAGGTYTASQDSAPTDTPTSPGGNAGTTTPADPVASAAGYDAALKQMESDPNFKTLPPSIQSLFRDTLKSYDFNKELNVQNVLTEFNRIKTETIDPRFSQEVNKFTNDLTKEVDALNASRDMEKETLAANAGQDIRQAKAGLEKAGMTFTGQAIEQLGAGSAYAQPGANVPTPVQTGFGGLFNEGTVNQSNRLMASSASNRYKQSINALGQQAENALGGAAVPGLVPGYSPSGTLPGSYADTKQSQYGQTLSQLMGQNYQNLNNNKNLNYNL